MTSAKSFLRRSEAYSNNSSNNKVSKVSSSLQHHHDINLHPQRPHRLQLFRTHLQQYHHQRLILMPLERQALLFHQSSIIIITALTVEFQLRLAILGPPLVAPKLLMKSIRSWNRSENNIDANFQGKSRAK